MIGCSDGERQMPSIPFRNDSQKRPAGQRGAEASYGLANQG
jgi:hypothetical protein